MITTIAIISLIAFIGHLSTEFNLIYSVITILSCWALSTHLGIITLCIMVIILIIKSNE